MDHDSTACGICARTGACELQAWADYFKFLRSQSLYALERIYQNSQGLETDFCEEELARRALTSNLANYFLNMSSPRAHFTSHWATAPCPN